MISQAGRPEIGRQRQGTKTWGSRRAYSYFPIGRFNLKAIIANEIVEVYRLIALVRVERTADRKVWIYPPCTKVFRAGLLLTSAVGPSSSLLGASRLCVQIFSPFPSVMGRRVT